MLLLWLFTWIERMRTVSGSAGGASDGLLVKSFALYPSNADQNEMGVACIVIFRGFKHVRC